MSADVSPKVKDDLLKDIASIPLVLTNVARAQTRPSRGNGHRTEESES
jgi:hypothetical protein